MKRIDGSPEGIYEIGFSPNGEWLCYVQGADEVRLANALTGEVRVVGKGSCPGMAHDMSVVFERDGEIMRATAAGATTVASAADIVKDTPKRCPCVSPDGKRLLFSVCNVYDKDSQSKNAYPHRHFLATMSLESRRMTMTREQWYGGSAAFWPDSTRFAHFEFDSTGGPQIHVVSFSGERQGSMSGLYPSISPDGTRIAARPRSGGSIVIYASKGTWRDQDIETTVLRVPAEGALQTSCNPPIWIDNRLILADEGGVVWRLDTRRDKPEEMKKIPLPVARRKPTWVPSPNREQIAMEVATEGGRELRLIPIA